MRAPITESSIIVASRSAGNHRAIRRSAKVNKHKFIIARGKCAEGVPETHSTRWLSFILSGVATPTAAAMKFSITVPRDSTTATKGTFNRIKIFSRTQTDWKSCAVPGFGGTERAFYFSESLKTNWHASAETTNARRRDAANNFIHC